MLSDILSVTIDWSWSRIRCFRMNLWKNLLVFWIIYLIHITVADANTT